MTYYNKLVRDKIPEMIAAHKFDIVSNKHDEKNI